MPDRKRIATIVTEYFAGLHAEVIVTKALMGFPADDRFQAPRGDLVSMCINSLSERDVGRAIAEQRGASIFT